MAMKRAVRDKWCAALRSGEYDQQQESLYSEEWDAYCCLGVLQGPVLGFPVVGANWTPLNSLMAPTAARKAGLPVPRVKYYGLMSKRNLQRRLAELNSTADFLEIADWIEKHVPVED